MNRRNIARPAGIAEEMLTTSNETDIDLITNSILRQGVDLLDREIIELQ